WEGGAGLAQGPPVLVQDHEDEADNGEDNKDDVLVQRHSDLGPGGEFDADYRNDDHDQPEGGVEPDVSPGRGRIGANYRQYGRGQDLHAAQRPEHVGGHHEPSGQETQIGVDGPAHPL